MRHWAGELNASYALASDFMRVVSKQYGVLIEDRGMANRATFVVDIDGKIQHIQEGSEAIDPEGALTACSRTRR